MYLHTLLNLLYLLIPLSCQTSKADVNKSKDIHQKKNIDTILYRKPPLRGDRVILESVGANVSKSSTLSTATHTIRVTDVTTNTSKSSGVHGTSHQPSSSTATVTSTSSTTTHRSTSTKLPSTRTTTLKSLKVAAVKSVQTTSKKSPLVISTSSSSSSTTTPSTMTTTTITTTTFIISEVIEVPSKLEIIGYVVGGFVVFIIIIALIILACECIPKIRNREPQYTTGPSIESQYVKERDAKERAASKLKFADHKKPLVKPKVTTKQSGPPMIVDSDPEFLKEFNYKGKLVMKDQVPRGRVRHALENDVSQSLKKIEFDNKDNEIYLIGTDVEIVEPGSNNGSAVGDSSLVTALSGTTVPPQKVKKGRKKRSGKRKSSLVSPTAATRTTSNTATNITPTTDTAVTKSEKGTKPH